MGSVGGIPARVRVDFAAHVAKNTGSISLDANDFPAWVVKIFNNYLCDPVLVRLVTWARLERTQTGDLFGPRGGIDGPTIARIATEQKEGVLVDDLDPLDLFSLVIARGGRRARKPPSRFS